MHHPSRRGDYPALAPSCAPALHEESYRSDRDKYSSKAPVFESEDLAHLVEGLWLIDASMVQDPEDWPGWTDLPLDAILAMIGGVA